MPSQEHRGRKPKFTPSQREQLAELIRQHGARGAIAHAPEPVCLATVLKIAGEFQIPLSKGRRRRRAA